MQISIITLFPQMFKHVFDYSITRRAQEKKLVDIRLVNLRQFGLGKHKTVDDRPFGGGIGMILRVDVLHKAVEYTKQNAKKELVVLLDPKGKTYNQSTAKKWSNLSHLVLLCGRYEGYDARISKFIDCEISIGDYVLSGGEIAAMVIIDSVTRLIKGVLKKEDATQLESFSTVDNKKVLEYPQYTRPRIYKGKSVPDILLSGHKQKIKEYRQNLALRLTKKKRPDLLED